MITDFNLLTLLVFQSVHLVEHGKTIPTQLESFKLDFKLESYKQTKIGRKNQLTRHVRGIRCGNRRGPHFVWLAESISFIFRLIVILFNPIFHPKFNIFKFYFQLQFFLKINPFKSLFLIPQFPLKIHPFTTHFQIRSLSNLFSFKPSF